MKKISKRFQLFVTIIVSAVLAAGCGQNGSQSNNRPVSSAYDKGLEIAGLMNEMLHSDEYISLMSGTEEIKKKAGEIAEGSYDKPSQAFSLSGFSMDTMFMMMGDDEASDGFSDALKDFVNHKMTGAVISRINAKEGASAIAAASVFSANKTFVSNDISEDSIYLYIYPDSYPVAVTFNVGENGAVSATGYFLLNEDIKSADEKDVQIQIEDVFKGYGCSVEKVK